MNRAQLQCLPPIIFPSLQKQALVSVSLFLFCCLRSYLLSACGSGVKGEANPIYHRKKQEKRSSRGIPQYFRRLGREYGPPYEAHSIQIHQAPPPLMYEAPSQELDGRTNRQEASPTLVQELPTQVLFPRIQ